MPNSFNRVCVIGCGEIGAAVLEDLKKHPNGPKDLLGVDTSQQVREALLHKGFVMAHSVPSALDAYDVYIITIFDSSKIAGIIDVIPEINNPLIIVESTINPSDIAAITYPRNETKVVVTCPHRFNPNDGQHRIFNLDRILGGTKDSDIAVGVAFYNQFMDRLMIHTGPFHVAALSKVIENTYRFYEIVFAQELLRSLEAHGFDFEAIRSACNTKWNIEIKQALKGVGGKCLPKDIHFFNGYFKENVLTKFIEMLNNDFTQERLPW